MRKRAACLDCGRRVEEEARHRWDSVRRLLNQQDLQRSRPAGELQFVMIVGKDAGERVQLQSLGPLNTRCAVCRRTPSSSEVGSARGVRRIGPETKNLDITVPILWAVERLFGNQERSAFEATGLLLSKCFPVARSFNGCVVKMIAKVVGPSPRVFTNIAPTFRLK